MWKMFSAKIHMALLYIKSELKLIFDDRGSHGFSGTLFGCHSW